MRSHQPLPHAKKRPRFPPADDYLLDALKRVGSEPERRVAWLLGFARRMLGEREDRSVAAEVEAFVNWTFAAIFGKPVTIELVLWARGEGLLPRWPDLSWNQVQVIQQTAKEAIESLEGGGTMENVYPIGGVLWDRERHRFIPLPTGTTFHRFLATMVETLQAVAPSLCQ